MTNNRRGQADVRGFSIHGFTETAIADLNYTGINAFRPVEAVPMPADLSLYPNDWPEISYRVRTSADWKCQSCGRDCRRPDESLIDFAKRILHSTQPEIGFVDMRSVGEIFAHPKKWELQACHLDQNPRNCAPENLKAMCCSCHRRYDNQRSQVARRNNFYLEESGQYSLL